MSEPVEHIYFNWLCSKVVHEEVPTPSLTFDHLLRVLQHTEFVWLLSGDDNRVEDGLELRDEFFYCSDIPGDPDWGDLGCSFLEMLIAFGRRAEFITDIPAKEWFWHFLENLDLNELNDASDFDDDAVKDVLLRVVWRQYDYDGAGGLFPLKEPQEDQTKVELWYQFSKYLVEQEQYE